jgi:hypothetical protein
MPKLIDCVTITKHTPERPIFIVGGLSLEAYKAGFVVLNPCFRATQTAIDMGVLHLNEYLKGHKDDTK